MKEKHDHDQSSHIATDVLGKQFFGCRHWEIAELILSIKCFHKAMEQKNEEKANEISQRMGPLLYQFSEYATRAMMIAAINGNTNWFHLVIDGVREAHRFLKRITETRGRGSFSFQVVLALLKCGPGRTLAEILNHLGEKPHYVQDRAGRDTSKVRYIMLCGRQFASRQRMHEAVKRVARNAGYKFGQPVKIAPRKIVAIRQRRNAAR